MKDKRKTLGLASLVLSVISFAMVILYNFMPIFSIYTDMNERFMPAKEYVGWEVTFYSYGGQVIYGYHHFSTNFVLCIGMIGSALILLITTIQLLLRKTSRGKVLPETVSAAAVLIGGVILVNAKTLCYNLSISDDIINEVNDAISKGNFKTLVYPVILCVVMVITAAVKALDVMELRKAAAAEEKQQVIIPALVRRKKLTVKLSVISVCVLALIVLANTLMNMYATTMNYVFGGGKQVVTETEEQADGNYYEFTCSSAEESKEYGRQTTQDIASEGITLLKNEDNILPLASQSKVSVFGYGSEHPYAQGSDVTVSEALADVFDVNPNTAAIYKDATTEPDVSAYASAESSFAEYGDAAFIVITRSYGEGNDANKDLGEAEYHRHDLTLSNNELAMLEYVCSNFENVIILVNSPNTFELGFTQVAAGELYTDSYSGNTYENYGNIKGVLWCGGFGTTGLQALDQILDGDVNPSGHLPDTYMADFTADPTYCNVGSFAYSNTFSMDTYYSNANYFIEYEEGIYVGYKYYETAAYEAANGNYDGFDYDTAVVYPFGYGLSYTDFEMAYAETPSFDEASNTYTFKVNVTNTGSAAGKAVAQIYCNPPYTQGGIEKSQVVLAGFAKTDILQPGESQEIVVTVNRDLITSYDYEDACAYVLEAGDYNFYLSENSHSWFTIDSMSESEQAELKWTDNVAETIVYSDEEDGKRTTDLTTATNALDETTNWKFKDYTEAEDGYATNMTRADFAASFPTAPTEGDMVADDDTLSKLEKYDVWDDSQQTVTETQDYGTSETTYSLIDLRGVDFDDEMWDEYINQFSLDSMIYIYGNGGWGEQADEEQGVPFSYDTDGPYGYFGHTGDFSGVNQYYCSIPVLAATFNTELATQMGDAMAEEAAQFEDSDGNPITGWYGPAINIHRTPFCGRNFEYFSEDSVLSGIMVTAETSAASEKGLICLTKHFALNEQETNRMGICTWANEQAVREVYLKPFELYIKNAKMNVNYYAADENGNLVMETKTMSAATGMMTSYNRVGAVYSSASSLLQVARNEWGFTGTVITDAGGQPSTYMNSDQALRAGTNLTLTNNGDDALYDYDSDTAIYWLKNSTKYLLYNKANSNCMIGISPNSVVTYTTAPWKIGLMIATVLAGLFIAGCVISIILMYAGKLKLKEKTVTVK